MSKINVRKLAKRVAATKRAPKRVVVKTASPRKVVVHKTTTKRATAPRAVKLDPYNTALADPWSTPVMKYPDGQPLRTVAHSLHKRFILRTDAQGNVAFVCRPWNWINYNSTPVNGNDSGWIFAQSARAAVGSVLEAAGGAVQATQTYWQAYAGGADANGKTNSNIRLTNFDNFAALTQVAERVRYVSGGMSFCPTTSDATDNGVFYLSLRPLGANAEPADSKSSDSSFPTKVGDGTAWGGSNVSSVDAPDARWDLTTVMGLPDTKTIPARAGFHCSLVPQTKGAAEGFLDSDGGITYTPDGPDCDTVDGLPNLIGYGVQLPADTIIGTIEIKALIEYTVSDFGTGVVIPTINAMSPKLTESSGHMRAAIATAHPIPGPARTQAVDAAHFAGNLIGGLDTAALILGHAGRAVGAGMALYRAFGRR